MRGRVLSVRTDLAGLVLCEDRRMATRVVIVDDHGPFRSVARETLEQAGFEVVGEAADARSGLDVIRSVRPDVVLLDVNLPDLNGLDVARRLAAESRSAAVVLISEVDSTSYRRLAGAGLAAGFIPKSELTAASLRAVTG